MKTLDFSLSDFSSFQNGLINQFKFEETEYLYLEHKVFNDSFFRRCFIESGFEIWICSIQLPENVTIKQVKTKNTFGAIHFINFEGESYMTNFEEPLKQSKGIYFVNGNTSITFNIKANETINFVSLVYSKRWIDINFLNTDYHPLLSNDIDILKTFTLSEENRELIKNLTEVTKEKELNSLILKMKVYSVFEQFLIILKDDKPCYKVNKLSLNVLIEHVEKILSKDFQVLISDLYEEIQRFGFTKTDFVKAFKNKNELTLHEYREAKKSELSLRLLSEGYKVKDVSNNLGFSSPSKFIEFFKREFDNTPSKVRVNS